MHVSCESRMKKAIPSFARIVPGASPFRLAVRRSPIDRYGVFALEDIPAGRKIIEYTGMRFHFLRKKWRKVNALFGTRRIYFFHVTKTWGVEGSIDGSGAELINHSCDPNIKSRIISNHVLYFSKRKITAGEELTVDYRFGADAPRYVCHCGAHNCRGTINVSPPAKRAKPR